MRGLVPLVSSIGIVPLLVCACAPSPDAPSRPACRAAGVSTFGVPTVTAAQAPPLAACLSASPAALCFSAATMSLRDAAGSPATAPGAPLNLFPSVAGSTVTLTWSAPAGGDPVTQYTIEAGSAPGLANLANIATGNALTIYQATGVGAGNYFVRVRAVNGSGISPPSNEVLVIVANAPCAVPGAPSGLALTANAGGTVSLAWQPATGTPTSYVLEAGSAPGSSDLANSDLGGAARAFTATGVAGGTYYVRVRAANACGISRPSNEVIVVVPSPFPDYAGTWTGVYQLTSCTSLDPAGLKPLDLCLWVQPGNRFEIVLSQSGAVLTGVYRNINPATAFACACGGQYGTFAMSGTVAPGGAIEVSGGGTLIGTGVSERLTLASIQPAMPGSVGLTGYFDVNGLARAAFSAAIVSVARQ